jgi:hypothetical protein
VSSPQGAPCVAGSDENAGATGLEPAASCVTGRRSNLGEAALVNVIKNWRTKGVFYAQTEDVRLDCLSDVGDRAAF